MAKHFLDNVSKHLEWCLKYPPKEESIEDINIILNPEIGFNRDKFCPIEIDCAYQGYFYCKECEAYTYHDPDHDSNICCVCSSNEFKEGEL